MARLSQLTRSKTERRRLNREIHEPNGENPLSRIWRSLLACRDDLSRRSVAKADQSPSGSE